MSGEQETGAQESAVEAITTPSPAAPTPYHRMAYEPGRRWWLPIVASVTLVVVAVLLQNIVVLAALFLDDVTDVIDEAFFPQILSYAVIGAILPAIFIAARVWRRHGGEISSVAGRIRWKWLLLCAALAVLAFPLNAAIVTLLTSTTDPASLEVTPTDPPAAGGPTTAATFATIALLLVLVPVQAATEEYLTRGWIVQLFGAYLRTPWVGVGVGALVFVLLHGESTIAGYGSLLIFALVLGWLVVRTGGLEAGIAFHAVWNVTLAVVQVLVGDTDAESNLGDSAWPELVGQLIVLPMYAFVVAKVATRSPLQLNNPS
jgi:membrane protease YdiL (CAAX protease family)